MNSLPSPTLHPHTASNTICDCFSHHHDRSLIINIPELFRCNWHHDDNTMEQTTTIEYNLVCSVAMHLDVRNPSMTEDDTDDHLITKFSLKQDVSQIDSHRYVSNICSNLSLVIQVQRVCEISLAEMFSGFIAPSENDPRLYPLQSKYHYCYSGFKVESDNYSLSFFLLIIISC